MALSLEKQLQAVKKEIESLSKKLNKITDTILKEKKPAKKTTTRKTSAKKKSTPKKKAAVKKAVAKKTIKKTAGAVSAPEAVYKIISGSKKGVDVATLMKKTRFNKRKVYDTVKVLKKRSKVKSIGIGVYGKA
jgi:TolA-binding protein